MLTLPSPPGSSFRGRLWNDTSLENYELGLLFVNIYIDLSVLSKPLHLFPPKLFIDVQHKGLPAPQILLFKKPFDLLE